MITGNFALMLTIWNKVPIWAVLRVQASTGNFALIILNKVPIIPSRTEGTSQNEQTKRVKIKEN